MKTRIIRQTRIYVPRLSSLGREICKVADFCNSCNSKGITVVEGIGRREIGGASLEGRINLQALIIGAEAERKNQLK